MTDKYKYENLTWPEVNEAVEKGLIPILPVGTTEQHGPHLPIKMDSWTARSIAHEAAKRRPDRLLVMPPIHYGYTTHVMDFPGSITIHHETFIRYIVDVVKSVVYHGFKKVIMVNGHGSNMPPLELAARRVMLETDAVVSWASWWQFTMADPEFMKKWRDGPFPGGSAHSGESETSLALYLDESLVKKELATNDQTWTNLNESKFHWVDLYGAGPVSISNWSSSYMEKGIAGWAAEGTKEKGEMLFEESVNRICEWADEFHAREYPPRVDHHTRKPTTDVPG